MGLVELAIVYTILQFYIAKRVPKATVSRKGFAFGEEENSIDQTKPNKVVLVLSACGWGYYLVIVSIYFNFVSYMMMAGGFMFGPTLYYSAKTYLAAQQAQEEAETEQEEKAEGQSGGEFPHPSIPRPPLPHNPELLRVRFIRVMVVGGLILLAICLALFPAVHRMPDQVHFTIT